MIPRAISVVMLAGIFTSGMLQYILKISYLHTFVGLTLPIFMTFLPVLSLIFYSPKNTLKSEKKIIAGRSYSELLSSHRFSRYSCCRNVIRHNVILDDGNASQHASSSRFFTREYKDSYSIHIIGMFLPSLFTGRLIKKFGHSQ